MYNWEILYFFLLTDARIYEFAFLAAIGEENWDLDE